MNRNWICHGAWTAGVGVVGLLAGSSPALADTVLPGVATNIVAAGSSSVLTADITPPSVKIDIIGICQPKCGGGGGGGGGGGSGDMGSTMSEGQTLQGGQFLVSPSGSYVFVMQTDGNLVEYQGNQALWASETYNHPGAWVTLQTDGNLVVYDNSGYQWASHTANTGSGNVLSDQDDGNIVMYGGGVWLWATGTATSQRFCWTDDSCTPTTYAYAVLGGMPEAPYQGVLAPTTAPNIYAFTKWEQREGGGGSGQEYCGGTGWPPNGPKANPVATSQPEPGSTSHNSSKIQDYNATQSPAETCWYWGIVAFDQTVFQPWQGYSGIVNVLRNPVNTNYQQCINLANAVGSSVWGTPNFSNLC